MADITALATYLFFFFSLYFEVFLLITFFERRETIRKTKHAPKKTGVVNEVGAPSVTVVVPCYNEGGTVGPTVRSLLNLSYSRGVSIIVVNDGSTDNTQKTLQFFAANPRVRILHKENGGKASALNHALPYVKTDLVACLDADSFVEKGTLAQMVPYFADKNVAAVTPALKIYKPSTLIQHIQSGEYHLGIFLRKIFSFLGAQFVTPGPFSIYRTDVLQEVGGFRSAHNTEDLEMALRIQDSHYKIENAHTAYVHTVAPKTFRALYKQRLRWTYGFLKNALDYRHMFFNRAYGNLGFTILPFALFSIIAALYFATLLIISAAELAMQTWAEVAIVGTPSVSLGWFYVNTQALSILGFTLIGLTIVLLAVARKVSHDVYTLRAREIWYYLALYGIIAPIWLSKAVLDVALNRQNKWK